MRFDLQFFAATDLINVLHSGTPDSYAVNGITGEARNPNLIDNDLSPEIKDFYDTDLLKNYRTKMVYGQFAKNVTMPYHRGGVVEFRKFNRFKKANKLQEGVIPEGQPLGVTKITGAIGQYGTYTAVSDILEMRGYDPVIAACIDEMSESAAERTTRAETVCASVACVWKFHAVTGSSSCVTRYGWSGASGSTGSFVRKSGTKSVCMAGNFPSCFS